MTRVVKLFGDNNNQRPRGIQKQIFLITTMIELRAARFSDCAAIAELHAENWRQTYRGIFSDNFLEHEVFQDRAKAWYKRLKFPTNNQYVTVATLDGGIVGFACLYLNDDPVFGSYLDNLHVSAGLQKSGVGKKLMKECAKVICDKGHSNKIYLWVYELNENACHIYDHLCAARFETIEKQNKDGSRARACRYVWEDVSVLM